MKRKEDIVERSYQLLALIDVCAHSAPHINQMGRSLKATGSLVTVLELASDVAGDIHDELETTPRLKAVGS